MDKFAEKNVQWSDTLYFNTGTRVEGQAAALACLGLLRQLGQIPDAPEMEAWLLTRQDGTYGIGCKLRCKVPTQAALDVDQRKSK